MKQFIVIAVLLCACAPSDLPASKLRVGVLPDQSREELLRQYTPLVEYLSTTTGLDLELVMHESYDQLVEDFVAGNVDLAWFGGLTFARAAHRSSATPLAMRDVDQRFTSFFVARAPADGLRLEDFEGRRFAFGPRLSTSGHLMPRYFLEKEGIIPETFFASVRHSGGHDETAYLVRDGEVDLGVANSVIMGSMFDDGRLNADEILVLQATPPYRDYVWAVPSDMNPRTKTLLMDAFLSLDASVPGHQILLKAQGAGGYIPASPRDFEEIRKAALAMGLLASPAGN